MDINMLLERSADYPGFQIVRNTDNIEIKMESETDKGYLCLFSIGPGIQLSLVRIEASQWSNSPSTSHDPLLLNYCIKGRCEVELDNGTFTFVSGKELAFSTHTAKKSFIYPGGYYEGLELFLDIEKTTQQPPAIFDIPLLNLNRLKEKYCADGHPYVAPAQEAALVVLEQLKDLCESKNISMIRIKVLELLLLLTDLPIDTSSISRTCYTGPQVRIARAAEALITENLSIHYTAKELARQFQISETSLKNYFRGVYGENYSVYQRDIRMKKAARLLTETSDRIAMIAGQVGYENQSKFAAVFRKHFGLSPAEYRKSKNLDKALKHMR